MKGNKDQSGPQLSNSKHCHKASSWPQHPCAPQQLWCQDTAWAREQGPIRQQEA